MNNPPIIRYLETTSKCNYNCPICVEKNRSNNMIDHDFYSIVNHNRLLLCNQRIWVDFCGEPLMDPHIFKRINFLNSIGAKVQLSTNGSLLDSECNIQKLVESGIDYIVVSIPSLNNEIYKKLRGVDDLDKVLFNLFLLKKYIDESKSSVQLQAVGIDIGRMFDSDKYIKFFHERGIHVAIHQFTNRAHNSRIDIPTINDFPPIRNECIGRKQNLAILSNCEVVTCSCDFLGENSLGNLRNYNYSVTELIAASHLDNMIQLQKKNIFTPFCQKCDDWVYYQRESIKEYVKLYTCPSL